MTNGEINASSAAVGTIWDRLIFRAAYRQKTESKDVDDPGLVLSAVERQTENSRKGGTIWEAVRKADEAAFRRLVMEDAKNVEERGPVGECPVHMLFLYGSETHLNMARFLIAHFPHTITQIYNLPVSIPRFFSEKKQHWLVGVLRWSGSTHRHHQTKRHDGRLVTWRCTESSLSRSTVDIGCQWEFL